MGSCEFVAHNVTDIGQQPAVEYIAHISADGLVRKHFPLVIDQHSPISMLACAACKTRGLQEDTSIVAQNRQIDLNIPQR
jgi:hypothetical protein